MKNLIKNLWIFFWWWILYHSNENPFKLWKENNERIKKLQDVLSQIKVGK